MIAASLIEDAAYEIMFRAGIDIPKDYADGIRTMARNEKGQLATNTTHTQLISISMNQVLMRSINSPKPFSSIFTPA